MAVPLYIISIVVLVLLSAFFSATETAFSSIGKLRLRTLAESDSRRSKIVVRLSEDYDSLISTILIGNNIVNIGATTLATLLFAILITNPTVAPTVSTIVMTLIVLTFGEITPKTIAKKSPEYFAHFASYGILAAYYVLFPLTWVFSKWQKLVGKLFKNKDNDAITDEQLITMVDEAKSEGGLDEYESRLIRSAIKFDDLTVMDILTPRVDMVSVSIHDDKNDILRVFAESGYSRLPVYRENIDDIIGILNEKDFYKAYIRDIYDDNTNIDIADVLDENVIFITNLTKISSVLRRLQREKTHIAIVVDEFGGTLGIVTLEDIIEELVGDIWDEHDEVEEDFTPLEDGRVIVRGDTNLEDFFEYFAMAKDARDFEPVTLGGLIVHILDRVASVGDVVDFDTLTLTVKSIEHHKIDTVEVMCNSVESKTE